MARRISELRTTNKSGNTSREYVLLSNIDTNTSTKIALNDVFPTLQSGKTAGTLSAGAYGKPQDLFVGGGVGSGTANSSKSVLIFKGIDVDNTATHVANPLEIRTDTDTVDSGKQNVVVSLDESKINLNNTDNSTSNFLSTAAGPNPINLAASSELTGNLGLTRGGTGRSSYSTTGGLLYASGSTALGEMAALAAGSLLVGTGTTPTNLSIGTTNGFVLTVDSTAPSGLKWDKPTISASNLTTNLNLNNNNLILGTGYITGTGAAGGLSLSSGTNYAYLGSNTSYYAETLTVDGNIALSNFIGTTSGAVKMNTCTSGASPALNILGSNNDDNNAGGSINITAGNGQTNANGGTVIISGGTKAGTGTDGTIVLKTAATNGLVVDNNQDVSIPNGQLQLEQAEPIGVRGTTSVIQATSLTTGVTLNSSAGIITLHTTALGGHDSVYFTLTNSVINVRSIIMLTTEVSNAEAAGAGLVAQVADRAAGSCKIRISNTGNASTTTDHSVHFFIVNEIV